MIKIYFQDYPSADWMDWSEYLIGISDLEINSESDNPGEAGVISLDEVTLSFLVGDNILRPGDINPVKIAFSPSNLDEKKRYIIKILYKTAQQEFQRFEGVVDLKSVTYPLLKEDSGGEYLTTIEFRVKDKLSALASLKPITGRREELEYLDVIERGYASTVLSGKVTVIQNTNMIQAVPVSGEIQNFTYMLKPGDYIHIDSVAAQWIKIIKVEADKLWVDFTFIQGTYTPGESFYSRKDYINIGAYWKSGLENEFYISVHEVQSTFQQIEAWTDEDGNRRFVNLFSYGKGQAIPLNYDKDGQILKPIPVGSILAYEEDLSQYGKVIGNVSDDGLVTDLVFQCDLPAYIERKLFLVVESQISSYQELYNDGTIVPKWRTVPAFRVKVVSVDGLFNNSIYSGIIKNGSNEYSQEYFQYSTIPYFSNLYLGMDLGIYENGVLKAYDAYPLVESFLKSIWPEVTVKQVDSLGQFLTSPGIIKLPLNYYPRLIDIYPFDKRPLEFIKFIADSTFNYIYYNSRSEFIIRSKKGLGIGGSPKQLNYERMTSGDKVVVWDKLIDGVEITVESWIKDPENGSEFLQGYSSQKKEGIDPQNSIAKSIFAQQNEFDQLRLLYPDYSDQDILDAYAEKVADEYMRFYGARHESISLEFNEIDDNSISLELFDSIIDNGLIYFISKLSFNIIDETYSIELVSKDTYEYDHSSVVFWNKDNSSSGSSNSSSEKGTFSGGPTTSADPYRWNGGTEGLDAERGRKSLGLDNIANIGSGLVTTSEFNALRGIDTTKTIKTQFDTLNAHASNISNPHKVTKSQIDLGLVDNIKQEPHLGTSDGTKYLKGDRSWGTFATDVRSSISAANPISYNSLIGEVALSFTENLKITSGQLDTVQPIGTEADVQFRDMQVRNLTVLESLYSAATEISGTKSDTFIVGSVFSTVDRDILIQFGADQDKWVKWSKATDTFVISKDFIVLGSSILTGDITLQGTMSAKALNVLSLSATGNISGANLNITNWNSAYNHSQTTHVGPLGENASGKWNISISGNAETVTNGLVTGTIFGIDATAHVTGTYNNLQVKNDSHTHDLRYFTESEITQNYYDKTYIDSALSPQNSIFEPKLPIAPVQDPANKFLNALKQWSAPNVNTLSGYENLVTIYTQVYKPGYGVGGSVYSGLVVVDDSHNHSDATITSVNVSKITNFYSIVDAEVVEKLKNISLPATAQNSYWGMFSTTDPNKSNVAALALDVVDRGQKFAPIIVRQSSYNGAIFLSTNQIYLMDETGKTVLNSLSVGDVTLGSSNKITLGEHIISRASATVLQVNNGFYSAGNIESLGGFFSRSNIKLLNKAGNGWLDFAAMDTSQSEARFNLSNIGSINVNSYIQVKKAGTAYFYANTTDDQEAGMQFQNNGTIVWSFYKPNASTDLRFYSPSGDVFTLTQAGAMTVRTSITTQDMYVKSGTNGYITLRRGDATNTGYIEFFQPNGTRAAYIGYTDGSNINFSAKDSSTYFRFSNGSVGIGTTSAPGGKLSIASAGNTIAPVNLLDTQAGGSTYIIDNGYPSVGVFGIRDSGGTRFAILNGNVGINYATPYEKLSVVGNIWQDKNYAIYSNGYTPEWSGKGYSLATDAAGTSSMVINNLTVRNSLAVYEFLIKQYRSSSGNQVITAASGRVASVSGNTITLENPDNSAACPFAVNDIIQAQTFSQSNVSTRLVQATVTAVSGFTLTLSYSSGTFQKGDTVFQWGNTTDSTRQNAFLFSVTDSNAPYMRIMDGVNSVAAQNDTSKIKAQMGKLSGLTSQNFGALSGYGAYLPVLIAEGNVKISGELYANIGGFGNTVASPTVKINSAGLYVQNQGAVTNVSGNGSYIGNFQSTLGFNGTILNHSGIFGYQNNTDVFHISATEAKIAGFKFDSNKIHNATGVLDGTDFTTTGIVLGAGGYLSAPKFLLKQDGDAVFKGRLEGATGSFSGSVGVTTVYEDNVMHQAAFNAGGMQVQSWSSDRSHGSMTYSSPGGVGIDNRLYDPVTNALIRVTARSGFSADGGFYSNIFNENGDVTSSCVISPTSLSAGGVDVLAAIAAINEWISGRGGGW